MPDHRVIETVRIYSRIVNTQNPNHQRRVPHVSNPDVDSARIGSRQGGVQQVQNQASRQPRQHAPANGVRRPAPAQQEKATRRPVTRAAAEFERARKHSNRVQLLKRILPIIGVLAIIVIAGTLFFSGSNLPSVDLGQLRLEDGKLVMDSPELNGTDSNQRPYSMTAARAIQNTAKPDRIALEEIQAKLPLNDEQTARITAGNGVYDAGLKTLELGGNIAVDTDDGMKIRMMDAQIDIETGRMETNNPVEVQTGRANVKSDKLTVEDNGKMIIFENRVRMTILPFNDEDGGGLIGIANNPADRTK
ncbi:MAG: LPS export ABC transporter periplasmic protein LptC [Rhizobiaceae bacterium]